MRYNISREFTTTPGGRSKASGPNSAEELGEILTQKLQESKRQGDVLEIEMDGVVGYGSSFLDELCTILCYDEDDDVNMATQKTLSFITSEYILIYDILDDLPWGWVAIKKPASIQEWAIQSFVRTQPFGVWFSLLQNAANLYPDQIFMQELPS